MPTVTRTLPLPAARAWELVADVRNHARWIPWTRVDVVDGVVVAVTGPRARRGGCGLVDRMVVERFDAPTRDAAGVADLVKVGAVLRGTARIEVTAAGPDAAAVAWSEDVHLAGPLPRRLTAALVAPVLTAMTWWALRGAAREAAGRVARRR